MLIFDLSGAYQGQDFYENRRKEDTLLSLRDLSGVNCYLSDESKNYLKDLIKDKKINDIHMIDSGNYHYLTYLFLERIDVPFSLILFDNHPDMKRPSFFDILSCGGWVLYSKERLKNLKNVYIIGSEDDLLFDEYKLLKKDIKKSIFFLDKRDEKGELSYIDLLSSAPFLNFYISIDKDVLSEEYATCNWSQGIFTPDMIINILKALKEKGASFLGADISGEDDKPCSSVNSKTNSFLINNLYPLL